MTLAYHTLSSVYAHTQMMILVEVSCGTHREIAIWFSWDFWSQN